jgi:hypothetical protein
MISEQRTIANISRSQTPMIIMDQVVSGSQKRKSGDRDYHKYDMS